MCCSGTCFSGGSRQTSCSKAAAGEGGWAGGGIWGTAVMWLTSDSCTASAVISSYSLQGSAPVQELRGEMVPMGHGKRTGGTGFRVRLQASEGAAILPTRGYQLAGPGACLGHPEDQRQSRGWNPGFLVTCRPRAVVAQAWCPAQANANSLQPSWAQGPHTSKKYTAKTALDGKRAELGSETAWK